MCHSNDAKLFWFYADDVTLALDFSKRAESNAGSQKTSMTKAVSDLGSLNIEINPFALVPPHLEDYDNYTKGYAHSDSSSGNSSATSTPSMMSLNEASVLSHEIVYPLIDELIDRVLASETVDKGLTPGTFHSFCN